MDDLFSLVDMDTEVPQDFNEDVDDLAGLVEPVNDKPAVDLDDLSALIEGPNSPRRQWMTSLYLWMNRKKILNRKPLGETF